MATIEIEYNMYGHIACRNALVDGVKHGVCEQWQYAGNGRHSHILITYVHGEEHGVAAIDGHAAHFEHGQLTWPDGMRPSRMEPACGPDCRCPRE